ncbi:class I SAM-dependent DNA methyltransferase [Staphylococcus cohnii]|uniref:class I SAM-dependent DNA methyltransferase n=1 Tax=Staphylococcus cohnii TaxID=29382 RepID=UPI00058913BA|nr:class I SAM-dependent methyltransferase [Staphylococcus cohnii]AYX89983.1 class I SAM-dependent methyltransferase [Staphylococcus cohnii]MDE1708964.1 class I SAM-dependent methyltransferase [Staphylococcus cohnii]OIS29390.1 methyltransferase [Staphylococcus cohnii]OIS29599.1 methyltransferase [Staphylococcus cohnii]OIS32644.1 methyltransferase [Staphylococcus cohnii]
MAQYEEMSYYYDQLTLDQPYESWLDIVNYYAKNKSTILDIGCGTGSFTSKLNDFDNITGMDLSVDMLSIAMQKSSEVNWIEGDMTEFDLNQQYDAITIFCDSLNYLTEYGDVLSTFQQVYHHLELNEGVFMFDVHTEHKMNTLFNNQSYIDETENVFLAWEAIRGEEPLSVWHDMTFFIKQSDNLYKRFDESHYQRTYSKEVYTKMLESCGFKHITTFVDFEFENQNDNQDGERLFFIVKK